LAEQITIKNLVEAGAHFGHQKQRWNPKMRRFIFEQRDGLYIIDLAKTLHQLRLATDFVNQIIQQHRSILFVGTKKQAKTVIKEAAEAAGEYFISERWLGGMLTNLSTIRQSIKKLEKTEKRLENGEGMTKKEISLLNKEREKLERNLGGIRGMRKPPGLVIVVDTTEEHLAVSEARKLGIPVLAIVDTNSNPDQIDLPIPANDDSIKSIRLIIGALADSIIDKKNQMNIALTKSDEQEEDFAAQKAEFGQKE
jgi:small subunit ribosomal protein S2